MRNPPRKTEKHKELKMTDFEIEKTMITGMVKSLFKGVRVVSDPRLVDEGSFKIMIPKKAAESCVIRYVMERIRKYAESVEMAFDNGLYVDPVLADDGAYFSISVVTVKRC